MKPGTPAPGGQAKWFIPLLPAVPFLILLVLEVLIVTAWPLLGKLSLPPAAWVLLAGILAAGAMLLGTQRWIDRVDNHPLLCSEEKIQNKDALVIGTVFLMVILVGVVLVGCFSVECFFNSRKAGTDTTNWRFYLPLMWAFAGTSVGGGLGFLFGLPKTKDSGGATVGQIPSHYIHTGLDDIVDWLTKGVTTVALVKAEAVLRHYPAWADELAKGLTGAASSDPAQKAFAEGLMAYFPIVGFAGVYLVTRTYLTGALTRADRSTLGAFTRVELRYADVLVLQRHWRALSSKGERPPANALGYAKKLAALSLADLRTPLEFALWAKAKSLAGTTPEEMKDALSGYENAITLNPNDPELLLDYSVALKKAGEDHEAQVRMEEAYQCLSKATDPMIRKQIYKSLTFLCLYQPSPGGFERALKLMAEYDSLAQLAPSGGITVNQACAWGQKFRYLAVSGNVLAPDAPKPIRLPAPDQWVTGMAEARKEALAAMNRALKIDPAWQTKFTELFVSANGAAEENDLEVFETDADFRSALGLPPLVPPVPGGVTLEQRSPTAANATWNAAPGATKYRPFKKVEGVDADFVALDLTSETQVPIENLPAKATVHFQVTAYNAAGESARSAVVKVALG